MNHAELLTLYQHGVITREELRAAMSWTAHECRRVTEHWTTKDGEVIAWADVETRHLWNIARMLVRACRQHTRACERSDADLHEARAAEFERTGGAWGLRQAQRWRARDQQRQRTYANAYRMIARREAHARQRDAIMAIDELDYRGALPTWDDLRIAWDRACGGDGGPNVADDPQQRPWCLIELWVGFRGEPTTSAEWKAARRDHEPGTLA